MGLRGSPDYQVEIPDGASVSVAFSAQPSRLHGNLPGHWQHFELGDEFERAGQSAASWSVGADQEFGQWGGRDGEPLPGTFQFPNPPLRTWVAPEEVDAKRRVEAAHSPLHLRRS